MIISIKDLLRCPRHFDFAFGSDLWRDRDVNGQILGLDGPLSVQMTISKEESNFVVEGHLSGGVRVKCERCYGLCPTCGINLNREKCDCREKMATLLF